MRILYTLRRPCTACPFLRTGGLRLPFNHAFTILHDLSQDQGGYVFPCHTTLDENGSATDETQHCAGAIILWDKYRIRTRQVQMACDNGVLDPSTLDGRADVYDSVSAMLHASRDAQQATKPLTGLRLRTGR